eukprot:TRINITY_DN3758_c0_g1_i2.p1 TRINITY_DN3758_c0_g1~~TRINITY_DN3758_c0_g1_i2.p1  ORF type:complete len:826 (-),score=172.52 TRINITY_DN3758_c0_g1_i2:2181-4490(-)
MSSGDINMDDNTPPTPTSFIATTPSNCAPHGGFRGKRNLPMGKRNAHSASSSPTPKSFISPLTGSAPLAVAPPPIPPILTGDLQDLLKTNPKTKNLDLVDNPTRKRSMPWSSKYNPSVISDNQVYEDETSSEEEASSAQQPSVKLGFGYRHLTHNPLSKSDNVILKESLSEPEPGEPPSDVSRSPIFKRLATNEKSLSEGYKWKASGSRSNTPMYRRTATHQFLGTREQEESSSIFASEPEIAELPPETPTSKEDPEDEGITLDELLDKLMDPLEGREWASTVLLTYRCFITPKELLEKVIEMFFTKTVMLSRTRLLIFLQHWVVQYATDFFSEKSLSHTLNEFFNTLTHKPEFSEWKKKAENIQSKLNKPINVNKRPLLNVAPCNYSVIDIWNVDPEDIAKQLTLIDELYFREIPLSEFLNTGWTKQSREELSPHICKIIGRFNQVSQWVRCEIVTEVSLKKRAELLGRWLEICVHLQKLNNFNALMLILAALNSLPIFRLKKTWNALSTKTKQTWAQLESIFDTRVLRSLTQSAAHPLIPFLGMFLTDLIQIEENTDFEGKINPHKIKILSRTISAIQLYQQEWYQFSPIVEIRDWLLNVSPIEDDEILEACSYFLEPKKGVESPPEMPLAMKEYLLSRPTKDRLKKKMNTRVKSYDIVPKSLKKTVSVVKTSSVKLSPDDRPYIDDKFIDDKCVKASQLLIAHREKITEYLDKLNDTTDPKAVHTKEFILNEVKTLEINLNQLLSELKISSTGSYWESEDSHSEMI